MYYGWPRIRTASIVRRVRTMRKATIRFVRVLSVCPSVRPSVRMEHLGYHWRNFHEILYLSFFKYLSRKFKFHYNLTRVTDALYENQYTFLIISGPILRRLRNVSEVVEKIKTYILCSIFFSFRKSYRLWDNVEKYCRASQATRDNMMHAHCMLDT